MEIINKNFRAFKCSIVDFDSIMKIYNSNNFIQGSPRTIKGDELFENHLAEVLLGNKEEFAVFGVEDNSKELISYAIYSYPKNSQFGFLKLGGTLPKEKALTTYKDTGAIALLRLGVQYGESIGRYDIFWSVKLSSYLPMCKLLNLSELEEEHRTYWLLHKVVYPQDVPTTSIEKYLLEHYFIERKYPIAIIHTCLKQKYRIEHFEKNFSVSLETLKKCTVPDYAFSTSTSTSLATSS